MKMASFPEMDWLFANLEDLCRQYPGKWLAAKNARAVAHVSSGQELRRLVDEAGVERPFIALANLEAYV